MKKIRMLYSLIVVGVLLIAGISTQNVWAMDKASLLSTNEHVLMLRPMATVPLPDHRGILAIGPASGQLEVAVADSGNFTIGVPGGAILLYGHPNPSTGGTTIRIDGVDQWNYYNNTIGTVETGYPLHQGNSSITRWNPGNNIVMIQTLTLVASVSGGDLDTVEIRYDVENNDTASHEIGLRIMLDTKLGSRDDAPFRVPGVGDVTSETEFTGNNVPQYFDVFDDLANPTVQAKATLSGGVATPPDSLILAHWGKMSSYEWDYVMDSTELFQDTAVGLYWNPETINPGSTLTCITYYGLGQMSVVSGDFTVALSSYDALTRQDNNTLSPNPFNITAYVQNSGGSLISGALATLTLPNGLQLEPGESAIKDLGDLTISQQKQISWLVRATDAIHGSLTYEVDVAASSGADAVQVTKDVTIPNLITIAEAEYFLDTDPGDGNGTTLTAIDGAFDSPSESVRVTGVNIPGLSIGQHALYVRYRNSLGTWSQPVGKSFIYACDRIITAVECFLDSDPGEGNGIALNPADGAFDSATEYIGPVSLPIAGLSDGAHTLYLRYHDQAGFWSAPAGESFVYICPDGTIAGNIETLAPGYQVGILGATITLDGTSYVTSTVDQSGNFVLTGVSAGQYTVTITADDHEQIVIPNVTVIAGNTTDLGEQIMDVAVGAGMPGDANENDQLDLGDVIFILQVISGIR